MPVFYNFRPKQKIFPAFLRRSVTLEVLKFITNEKMFKFIAFTNHLIFHKNVRKLYGLNHYPLSLMLVIVATDYCFYILAVPLFQNNILPEVYGKNYALEKGSTNPLK